MGRKTKQIANNVHWVLLSLKRVYSLKILNLELICANNSVSVGFIIIYTIICKITLNISWRVHFSLFDCYSKNTS